MAICGSTDEDTKRILKVKYYDRNKSTGLSQIKAHYRKRLIMKTSGLFEDVVMPIMLFCKDDLKMTKP